MKNIFLIFIFLFTVFTLGLHAVQAQETAQVEFDKANMLLEQGDYHGALKAYHIIEDQGFKSSFLYLNMGISAAQIDSLGLAKYYFLKTIKHFPNDAEALEEAERALLFVNSQFSRQSATLPKLPWDKALDWLKEVPTAYGVFWFGYLMGIIACLLLVGKWFSIITFKKLNQVTVIFAISAILIVTLAYYVSYIEIRFNDAVIINTETKVLQQPTKTGTTESFAFEGYTLTIDYKLSNENPDWYYVRLSNGQLGWIKKTEVKPL